MRRSLLAITFAILAAAARPAHADLITTVTATSTMGSGFGTDLANTVNGAGLSTYPSLTAIHASTDPANSWVGRNGTLSGEITFNLHGLYLIDQFAFWNQNNGGPGLLGSTGIRNVVVLNSTDGLVFNPIAGSPNEFARVTASIAGPETFTFGPVLASHVRFAVLNNWGDVNNTGFGEVAFHAVPEPSSLVMSGTFGVIALCWVGLKRRLRPRPGIETPTRVAGRGPSRPS